MVFFGNTFNYEQPFFTSLAHTISTNFCAIFKFFEEYAKISTDRLNFHCRIEHVKKAKIKISLKTYNR